MDVRPEPLLAAGLAMLALAGALTQFAMIGLLLGSFLVSVLLLAAGVAASRDSAVPVRRALYGYVLACAGVVLLATAACEPGSRGAEPTTTATTEQDREGINKTRNEYVSAWKAADADQLANLYTTDALVLYPNQPAVVGRSAILAYFKSSFAELAPEDFELTSAEIEIVGPWAFDRGMYRWKAVTRSGGHPMADYGKYLVILQRQPDGSWKVARDMDNSDGPLVQTAPGPA